MNDELDLLKRARPNALDRCDDATRERLFYVATHSEYVRPRPVHRRVFVPAVAISAVAAALVCLLVVSSSLSSGSPAPTNAATSARDVLLTAAHQVEATTSPQTGRYWHVETRTEGLHKLNPHDFGRSDGPTPAGTPAELHTERWVARSDRDASWTTGMTGTLRVVSNGSGNTFDFEGRALTLKDVAKLPTDPAALKAFLLAPYPQDLRNADPHDVVDRLFGQVFNLGTAPASPAVRAAAFRLLADMPDVQSLGEVRDDAGRTGQALAIDDRGTTARLIIDPNTGAALEFDYGSIHNILLDAGWTNTVTP